MGFSQSTRARNCNNSVFDEAKEIVQFSNQCLVERRDTLGIQSSFGGYGYGDHKCSTNGPKNKITMIRVVIIGYAIISCLKYDCCVYNHFVTIIVGVIIVVIQICWRLGYGTITMTIRIHRKGKQDMIV
jgi:hypothetical protein